MYDLSFDLKSLFEARVKNIVESLDLLVPYSRTEQKSLFVGLAYVGQAAEGIEKGRDIGPIHRLDRGQGLHHERHVLILHLLLNRSCTLA